MSIFGDPVLTGVSKTSASGPIASFSDGAKGLPLRSLLVNIEPVQDLHGYDNPWPAGGGKNKFNGAAVTTTHTGNWEIEWDSTTNVLVITQKASYTTGAPTFSLNLPSGTYVASYQSVSEIGQISLYVDGSWVKSLNNVVTFEIDSTKTNEIRFAAVTVTKFQLESGSIATSWSPYENICPISGWSAVNVWVKPTYDPTANPTATIQLGQTVYGGTLDATNGVLTVDRATRTLNGDEIGWRLIANQSNPARTYVYNRDSSIGDILTAKSIISSYIPSHIFSGADTDIGIYVASGYLWIRTGTMASMTVVEDWENYLALNPLQVVYELATPITISLTPAEISTLQGQNNVWADSGDVDVVYLKQSLKYIGSYVH